MVGLSGEMWGSEPEQAENGCNGANTEPKSARNGGSDCVPMGLMWLYGANGGCLEPFGALNEADCAIGPMLRIGPV